MYCWSSISAMLGASLVITRRVVKADYGWTIGQLNILIIIEHCSYTCCHNFSFKNYYHAPIVILFIPTYQPTFQLVSVQETKDLVEVT